MSERMRGTGLTRENRYRRGKRAAPPTSRWVQHHPLRVVVHENVRRAGQPLHNPSHRLRALRSGRVRTDPEGSHICGTALMLTPPQLLLHPLLLALRILRPAAEERDPRQREGRWPAVGQQPSAHAPVRGRPRRLQYARAVDPGPRRPRVQTPVPVRKPRLAQECLAATGLRALQQELARRELARRQHQLADVGVGRHHAGERRQRHGVRVLGGFDGFDSGVVPPAASPWRILGAASKEVVHVDEQLVQRERLCRDRRVPSRPGPGGFGPRGTGRASCVFQPAWISLPGVDEVRRRVGDARNAEALNVAQWKFNGQKSS